MMLAQMLNQSAMQPTGDGAAHVFSLWQVFVWVCVIVWVLVMIYLLIGVRRARRMHRETDSPRNDTPIIAPETAIERRTGVWIGGFVGVTTATVLALMIGDFLTGRSLASIGGSKDFVGIAVIGRQWWWEVQYQDATPSNTIVDANEIHIPVGKPVRIELRSPDVIHSFWVPNLAGKKDLIPGHPSSIWLKADKAGTYQGQCAEFCGLQHAKMRFIVIAHEPADFERWLSEARKPAHRPENYGQQRGLDVFLSSSCIMCHSINGTPAFGRTGPNLTHVASRQTIAAGAVPNRPGHLAGWVVDPQRIKPGTRMPQNSIPPDDLRALLEYLESLK